MILLESEAHRFVLAELFKNARVIPTKCLQEHSDGLLALAVNANTDHVLLIDFEFEPSTTAWNDLGGPDVFIGRLINRAFEVDARRPNELRNRP